MIDPNEAPEGAVAVPFAACHDCMFFTGESCKIASSNVDVSCVAGARKDKTEVHYKPIGHIDITDPQDAVVNVDAKTDAETQKEMIQFHHRCLCQELGREPTMLETCQSWVGKGFAALYREHFKVVAKQKD